MDSPFPWIDSQGNPTTKIVECFVYLDGPVLFLMDWENQGHYLVVLVDEDEDESKWVASELSTLEILDLGAGSIDFYRAFTAEGDKRSYRISTSAQSEAHVSELLSSELQPSELPTQGYRLPPQLLTRVSESTQNTLRAILRITGETEASHHPSPRDLANFLTKVQTALDVGVAHALQLQIKLRGRLPARAIQQSALSTVAFAPGSFGVVVERTSEQEQAPLPFGEAAGYVAPLDAAFETLASIVEVGADRDELTERFRELGARYAINYRRLLEDLGRLNAGLAFEWASPQKSRRSAVLSATELPKVLVAVSAAFEEVAEQRSEAWIEVRGTYPDRERFWIRDPEDGSQGSDVIVHVPEGVGAPQAVGLFHVVLVSRLSVDAITGEERVDWSLERIIEAE